MKKFMKRYLEKIAEQNKKNFGRTRLDCCDLNRGESGQRDKKIIKESSKKDK
ncbi:LDCC motif putative metal-binding protein [Alkalibacter saccharofermentans]|uniref:Uncharacterized protein n=1 Tax=Alkalibacter saccharofermentans DSM 14828 TaxID=1120975 RepID=A0A1M4WWR6_9FIRM|nr:LDCC motif putative metal-binding protein [Alkalibacter saccharofermentans]SHE85638.1 hypothetical protein SAMN02746064_01338 [Alkalibacter saccharofermentans DSM 14828]